MVRETQATCGNGSIEVGEACDDGNEANDDGCTNSCAMAICGDAVQRTDLEPGDDGFETCDDGNDVDTDGCTNACLVARCGDGVVRTDLDEGTLRVRSLR